MDPRRLDIHPISEGFYVFLGFDVTHGEAHG